MVKKGKMGKKKMTLKDLEKQSNKSELNIESSAKEKKLKPSTTAALKGARVLIYGTIIFIIAVGTFQILRSKQPKNITNIVKYDFAPSEDITAQSFGLAFAKEYLTYSRDSRVNNSYRERIMPFMINAIADSIRIETSKGSSEVVDAQVWKIEKLDDNHSNIIVRADVKTINDVDVETQTSSSGEIETIPKVKRKIVYISVPVLYANGSYVVDDYPTFVPAPELASDVGMESYIGQKMALDHEKEEFKEILSNFFLTYTTGNEGQISYYMENNQKIKGYENAYIFNSIKSLDAYMINGNEAIVVVQVLFKDAELDTIFVQRFTFELVKKSEDNKTRWYIKEFNQRGNLYNDN